uniref:Uncharacterized protein n=1 Tax=Arundo donax TaxID=35708 RepID=A0A0A9BG79_ARUDO
MWRTWKVIAHLHYITRYKCIYHGNMTSIYPYKHSAAWIS